MQIESSVHTALTDHFGHAGVGPFAVTFRQAPDDLALAVGGVGEIAFPVPRSAVRSMRSVARVARFGRGEDTLVDKRVRDTWVIAKSRVKIDGRRFRQTLGPALRRIHEALALPDGTSLSAHLHDLLVYEKGQFFLPHRDAEKRPDMVGTLVVLLPSSFEGGASVIRHGGKELVVPGGSRDKLTFVAFFSNCEHEVRRVVRGHRVALTYELLLEGTPRPSQPEPAELAMLRALVTQHFEEAVQVNWRGDTMPPDRLVFLLDHEYTKAGLSWRRLKGRDAGRGALLRAAADELGCELHLSTAEVHESWSCEDDGGGYDGGHERWWGHREPEPETSDSPHPPLIEMYECEVVLDAWIDADDERTGDEPSLVEAGELTWVRPSGELAPSRLEHEGYMGNYGHTVDRWYQRAAIVLWPRERAFVVHGKHAPAWAANQVRAAVDAGRTEDAEQMVRELAPHWTLTGGDVGCTCARDVVVSAAGLEDRELAATWVGPLTLDQAASVSATALLSLVRRHGAEWMDQAVDSWSGRHRERGWWQKRMAPLAASLSREPRGLVRWFARLLETERAHLDEDLASAMAEPSPKDAARQLEDLRAPFAAVLVAASNRSAQKTLRAMRGALERACAHASARHWVVDTLADAAKAMSATEQRAAGLDHVANAASAALDDALAAPQRKKGDWAMDPALGCGCGLCAELLAFLTSKDETKRWPLAKRGRMHVHRIIDRAELPVTHVTMRRGSPFTLVLSKTAELFAREVAARKRVRKDVKRLTAAVGH